VESTDAVAGGSGLDPDFHLDISRAGGAGHADVKGG
jgi:hypothetical protein